MSAAWASPKGVYVNSLEWKPAIISGPQFSLSWFKDRQPQPLGVSYGQVSFAIDKAFANDQWLSLNFDGALATLWVGNDGDAFASYRQIWTGSLGQIVRDDDRTAHVVLLGPEAILVRDLLSATYAGTGGAEGPSSLIGTLKPFAMGACTNVTPVLVDAVNRIYQVHAYGTCAINAVYEGAISLGTAAATATDYASLAALTLADGTWAAAPNVGMFRLADDPTTTITADVGSASTVGAIVTALMTKAGLSSAFIDSSVATATAGYCLYASDQASILDLIHAAALSGRRFLIADSTGKFHLATHTSTKTAGTLRSDRSTTPLVLPDTITQAAVTAPAWQVKVGHTRNWTLQTSSDILAAVAELGADIDAAQAAADAAQTTANTASATANAATVRLASMANDNVLDRTDKLQVVRDVTAINAEVSGIQSSASGLGITTELTTYNNAYSALITYLSGLSPAYTDTTTDTAIVASTFNTKFGDYYTARQALLNKIAAVSATRANWTGVTGTPNPIANVTNTTVIDNSNITITGTGQINTGSTTLTPIIDNGKITVNAGTLTGIGTANVVVDNSKLVLNANGVLIGGGPATVPIDALQIVNGPAVAGATKNIVTTGTTAPASPTNGDVWNDTSTSPATVKLRVAGAWVVASNYVTGTAQIADTANLGNTAIWTSVGSRPTELIDGRIAAGLDATGQVARRVPSTFLGDVSASNVVLDPYFNDNPTSWTLYNYTAGNTAIQFSTNATALAQIGTTKAIRLIAGQGAAFALSAQTTVPINGTYSASARFYVKAGFYGAVQMSCIFYDATGTQLDQTNTYAFNLTSATAITADTVVDVSTAMKQAPSGTAKVAWNLYGSATGGDLYFGLPLIQRATTPGNAVLGDTTNFVPDPDFLDPATAWKITGSWQKLVNSTNGKGAGKNKIRGSLAQAFTLTSTPVTCVPNTSVTASIYREKVSGTTGGLNGAVYAADSTGAFLAYIGFFMLDSVVGTGRVSVIGKTPANTASVAMLIYNYSGGGDVSFDLSEPVIRFNTVSGGNLVRADGTTVLNDAAIVTASGTAAFVNGQGPLATATSVAPGYLAIGDTSNMVLDPDLKDATSWTFASGSTNTVTSTVLANLGARSALKGAATTTSVTDAKLVKPFTVEANVTYTASARAYIATGDNYYSRLQFIPMDKSGADISVSGNNFVVDYRPAIVGGSGATSDQYLTFTVALKMPSNAVQARIELDHGHSGGTPTGSPTWAVPRVQRQYTPGLLDIGSTVNMVPDPEFRDVASWSGLGGSQYLAVLPNTTAGEGSGLNKIRITPDGTNVYPCWITSKKVPVEAGKSYFASIYMKVVSAGTAGVMRAWVEFFNSAGTSLGATDIWYNTGTTNGRQSVIIKAPANAAFANMAIIGGYGTTRVWEVSEPILRPIMSLGATVTQGDGTTLLTDAAAITSVGTAAYIANQGTGATANNIAGLNATEGAKFAGIEAGASNDTSLRNPAILNRPEKQQLIVDEAARDSRWKQLLGRLSDLGIVGTAQNLVLQSENFGTTWSGGTVTANDMADQDGDVIADKVVLGANGTIQQFNVGAAGSNYVADVWAYSTTSVTVNWGLYDNVSGGQYVSQTIPANTWTLLRKSATFGAGSTDRRLQFIAPASGATVWLSKAQLRLSSYPPLYAATTTATYTNASGNSTIDAAVLARDTQRTYRNGLSPAWNDATQETTFVRATWQSNLSAYLASLDSLDRLISVTDSTLATWAAITGTGKPADGATVGAVWGTNLSGRPTNIAALTGTEVIRNDAITVDASGLLQGIGTASVPVDNTKQLWTQVVSRPLNLSDLDGTANAKLSGIQANATVGATWGVNIGSQPTSLSGINSTEGTKLGGIASGATKNIVTTGSTAPSSPADGDVWNDTSTTPATVKLRVSGAWVTASTNVTNTNQITDGAGLGTTAVWSSVSGTGKPADNATVGAVWGTNLSGRPANLAALVGTEGINNANQLWSDVSGTGKPADNATVGAVWGTNLSGRPANLASLSGSEGILNSGVTMAANGTLIGAGGGAVAYDSLPNGSTYGKILLSELSSGAHKLGVAGSGAILGDQRNIPAITSLNMRSRFSGQTVSYSASAGSPATATISVSAFTALMGSASISYGATSVSVSGTGGSTASYYLYFDDVGYTGGTKTLVATTNPNDLFSNNSRVFVGSVDITFPTSGTGGGSGGGGGGGGCVDEESWIALLDSLVRAREVCEGDPVECATADMSDARTVVIPCTLMPTRLQPSYRLTTASGATVIASASTPMTLRDLSTTWVPDMLGHEALVKRDGVLTWEEVVAVEFVGLRRVVLIGVNDGMYFAGEHAEAMIATHNIVSKDLQ
ncbi:MAG: hypothetical protein E7773_10245 [Sphingomonas sp.]|uniref:hypothetical protein n=1 Tax=Sphingomonas sp. TaxID=28214 RepID=UPI0012271A31|nr:hypothetical protein [Sphingomonas sp.]THD35718.1 MAG: hypothetical protein E7773_10245 [Sphingomonas sp.]